IKRYIDTKPNHELIHYCLKNPPYELGWKDKQVPESNGNLTTTTERVFERYKNVKQDIRDQLNAEAEAVQIILTGIDNDIYSTVDACPNACEMCKAIERLKQGKSINVQDLKTNLYWEFRKFTSQDGEGSSTPTEPHHTPFPEVETSYSTTSSIPLPSIPTAPIPTVTQPDPTPIRQYTRSARIAQSFALPTIADEPTSPVRDVSEGEDCPTDSGFIADRDRATIDKSFTLPYDSTPKVTSPAADEGSMQQNISELTALCTSLQRQYSELMSKFQAQEEEIGRLKERVQVLKDREGVATKQSGDDAQIKGRSNNEGEAAAERISNDSEEIARVLTSMDAATVLAGEIDVPTGNGFIPTAGPPAIVISTRSEVGPTASPIVTRRKGKEVMVESDTPKKKKLQEQIDAQVARELEEQQEKEDMRLNE
nr:hypothetical protein [Tanacetum cinerariifolium]